MKRIHWTQALSTGHGVIDAQHQELFARAGRLADALGQKRDGELRPLIHFLHAYAVDHFGAEEAYMRERGFAGLQRHKAQHDRFIADLLGFAEDLDRQPDDTFLARRVADWLARWLSLHVSGTDAELASFLARKGA
ncbi:MAG TPA: bacteriohemerythrin [Anaeromyxobacteraceae bacterium]|nr:bacteriohemerythrin [Anaeromyxobacteraceae bacterium]